MESAPLFYILLLQLAFVSLDAVPLNLTICGERCTEHGTCNPETSRCECPLLRHGLDCSIPYPEAEAQCKAHSHSPQSCFSRDKSLCLNRCNDRGWCEAGFCQCHPGFYGADCALSLGADGRPELLAGQGYVPRQRGVKIYVYELPPVTNTWVSINRVDQPLVAVLLQRLLSAGVRTADGDTADFYFIPLLLRSRNHAVAHLTASLGYVRRYWPWWERAGGGHRHLLVAQGEYGRRQLPAELLDATENVTFLTYWGLHTDHPVGGWPELHRPGQDIVVPPLTPPDTPVVYSPLHTGLYKRRKRRHGLFFAGRICGDDEPVEGRCRPHRTDFSGGTRQKVSEHHWNRTHWHITHDTASLVEGMVTHMFCLVPSGGGYGRRSVQALVMGCIPVTITDGVHQPFEPELNWADFSVPVAEADIPRLHTILNALKGNDTDRLQSKVWCAAQHMYYSSTFGDVMGEDGRYDAFETLMEVLRMRRDYPQLRPEWYVRHDKDFADFMRCRLKPTGGKVPLCTQNRLAKAPGVGHCRKLNMTSVPLSNLHMFYSWPGGAICGRNTSVATCPRSWK